MVRNKMIFLLLFYYFQISFKLHEQWINRRLMQLLVTIWKNTSLVKWLSLLEYATYTSHFLTTLNGSINVFIYFFKHKKDFIRSCVGILTSSSFSSSPRNMNKTETVSGLLIIWLWAENKTINYIYAIPLFQTAVWLVLLIWIDCRIKKDMGFYFET